MTRREALLSAGAVFVVALVVRAWAATQITYPRPEDVAYYVGVARNLLEGRGLTTDAIWSFQTPPLSFPRAAFEAWLPLPSFLMAVPMAVLGTTFGAAQVMSIAVGAIVSVLAWRLGADVAVSRSMPPGRARTLALGAGLTSAVYLPLVLASVQPDSTMPFAALVLLACLLMHRVAGAQPAAGRDLVLLGIVLGLAALTRNEAIWLALVWAVVAWGAARSSSAWLRLIGVPAIVALVVFAPWAVRDWLEFGSPLPGQVLTNALSLDGRDIFAWHDQPTLARYLDAGLPRLLELRVTGTLHNLTDVLLLLGVPLSVIGLVGLPGAWRARPLRPGPLRPLFVYAVLTFLVASLVFPVSTTWGTFLHAAGAIHVLLVVAALLALDWLIGWVGAHRGWTRPVAWLAPTFAIAGCLLFSAVLLPGDGRTARSTAAAYTALAAALDDPAFEVRLSEEPGPVISDFPIWLAEATRHHAIALPNESPDSIRDLARSFDPPARLIVFDAANDGVLPTAIRTGAPGSECFFPVALPVPSGVSSAAGAPGAAAALESFVAFRIRCP